MKKKKNARAVAEMERLEERVVELENKWKRALADYQNLEKRMEQKRGVMAQMASVGIIDKLLPVLDDLQRAAAHLKEDGVRMVAKQFMTVLQSEGVERIEALGQEFDPMYMDCVEMVEGNKNKVIEIVDDGYMLGETVIRPAKVKVGAGKNSN